MGFLLPEDGDASMPVNHSVLAFIFLVCLALNLRDYPLSDVLKSYIVLTD